MRSRIHAGIFALCLWFTLPATLGAAEASAPRGTVDPGAITIGGGVPESGPVLGNSTARGNVTVSGNATITGNATVSGNRTVHVADPTGFAVNPALKAKMDEALGRWIKAGGVEFFPSLTYVAGRPVLMLITDPKEPSSVLDRRQSALVKACEFLLADGAFDRAVICVVESDAPRGKVNRNRNTEVRRDRFRAAVKGAGKSDDLPEALAAVRTRMTHVRQVCEQLGLR